MDITRVVPVPLSKEPAVLWGLGLKDLVWLALGVILDLLLWPHSAKQMVDHVVAIIVLSGATVALAVLRYQDLSIPAWCLIASRFLASPKRYIPY